MLQKVSNEMQTIIIELAIHFRVCAHVGNLVSRDGASEVGVFEGVVDMMVDIVYSMSISTSTASSPIFYKLRFSYHKQSSKPPDEISAKFVHTKWQKST